MQNLVILGATGSIGSSTLAVIAKHPQTYNAYALVAHSNVEKMLELAAVHQPQYIHMVDAVAAQSLKAQLNPQWQIEVLTGDDELIDLVTRPEVDQVMAAIVGAAGLLPTLAAVKAGKRILLANKESLVMSGQLFMDAAKASGAEILPVDSEHNAIFQCLPVEIQTNLGFCDLSAHGIEHILLTGSGGPFLTTELSQLAHITPAQACKHPNWSMGPKISVDSATMMNKGLEYIEARWLFNTKPEQLKVVVHPQSVIHSMVQYHDGSVIAQLGRPDMRTPIANAMAYPERLVSGVEALDFFKLSQLTFAEADIARYPCLHLAIQACHQGQGATTVLNAANEIAVAAFLKSQIAFTQIAVINEKTLTQLAHHQVTNLDEILALDSLARQYANSLI